MQYEDLIELVEKRRNIRAFSDEPVDEGTIEKILNVVRRAPSGANSQPWEFIVISDDNLQEQVCEIYKENHIRRIVLEKAREPEYRFWSPDAPEPDPETFTHPFRPRRCTFSSWVIHGQ